MTMISSTCCRLRIVTVLLIFISICAQCYLYLSKAGTSKPVFQLEVKIKNDINVVSTISSDIGDLVVVDYDLANESNFTVIEKQPKATIAYAISITGCDESATAVSALQGLIDAAVVLKHSIHLNSIHNAPTSSSNYSYQMYAFIHPGAVSCTKPYWPLLQRSSYNISVRDTPFNVTDLHCEFLRTHMPQTGCCGEKEFLKLYAYTLTDHPIAVHLDADTLVLQPLDELFDSMLDDDDDEEHNRDSLNFMNGTLLPPPSQPIEGFFTRDYFLVHPGHQHVGVQGGFFVLRPNETVFEEQIQAILNAEFIPGQGWGGKYGGYYGAQQIQGFLSYYYDGLHPNTAIELDYCLYNNMVHYPISDKGQCYGPPNIPCQDCRKTDFSDIKTAHFTLCQKPWTCNHHRTDDLCFNLTREWFRIRSNFELESIRQTKSLQHHGKNETNTTIITLSTSCDAKHHIEEFFGCCKSGGLNGYIPFSRQEIQ